MKDVVCVNCGWKGLYTETECYDVETLRLLGIVLYRDQLFLGALGYKRFLCWDGYWCPNCGSHRLENIHKLILEANKKASSLVSSKIKNV